MLLAPFSLCCRLRPSLLLLSVLLVISCPPCKAQTSITSVAGYDSDNDSYQHAIVGTDDCRLHETYFNQNVTFHDEMGCYGPIISQSSFYSEDDGMQHVLIAKADGTIRDVNFSAGTGVLLRAPLITVPAVISVAGFYAANDKMRILLIGSNDGTIREVFYDKANVVHNGKVIATIPPSLCSLGFTHPMTRCDMPSWLHEPVTSLRCFTLPPREFMLRIPRWRILAQSPQLQDSIRRTTRCDMRLWRPVTAISTRSSTTRQRRHRFRSRLWRTSRGYAA